MSGRMTLSRSPPPSTCWNPAAAWASPNLCSPRRPGSMARKRRCQLVRTIRPTRAQFLCPDQGPRRTVGPSKSRPSCLSNYRGRRSRNGFPTTNRTSPGSTNPGNYQNPTQTGSINLNMEESPRSPAQLWQHPRLGIHLTAKGFPTKTAARIFQLNSLAKRSGWLFSRLRSFPMNPAANHCSLPKFAVWSLELRSVRKMFRPFGSLFHRNPFSPPTSPATGSFNGLHRESNFLAFARLEEFPCQLPSRPPSHVPLASPSCF